MKQVCVVGLGQFGTHIARTLVLQGCEVLVIDQNERRVERVRDDVQRALIGDARDYELLASTISNSLDEAVVCLGEGSIEPSILCTLHLKQLGVAHIRSTARNDDHARILESVGANRVIFPERESAERTARQIANPGVIDMFPLSEDFRILELEAPASLVGKTLIELDLRRKSNLMVLAVRGPGAGNYQYLPAAEERVRAGETLMVLGRELDLVRLAEGG